MEIKWLPRSWIPNTEGYGVLLLLKDGSKRQDVVVKDTNGTYRLKETLITQVAGYTAQWV